MVFATKRKTHFGILWKLGTPIEPKIRHGDHEWKRTLLVVFGKVRGGLF